MLRAELGSLALALLAIGCESQEVTPIFRADVAGSSGSGEDSGVEAGGNPASCPADRPAQGACDAPGGTRCAYGLEQCLCFDEDGRGTLATKIWECSACPELEPMSNAACSTPLAQCVYGSNACYCLGGAWVCGDCPAAKPVQSSACTFDGIRCIYGETQCYCRAGAAGDGGARGWVCAGGGVCPAETPIVDSPCSEPLDIECTYDTLRCGCFGLAWRCVDVCLPQQPATGRACLAPAGTACAYGQAQCVCFGGQWQCS